MRHPLARLLGAAWFSVVAALLQPVGAAAQGRERIVDFESRIEVHTDAAMTVTETITVVSAGRKIKRGIYRDFPTTYRDEKGRTVIVGFEVLVGIAAVAFYDLPLQGWPWLLVVFPLVALGLALLGTLAGSIVSSVSAGTALVPLLVAPLSVPLLLAATQALEGLRLGRSILSWLLLMATVVLVLAIVGVLTARPLQETR